ncbi:hypothetical protein DAD186_14380 [Dermabacter vaginalis]|uniref:Uncharacterized protein n=1 Tax=Dermabacter vaginalis TaxID=1630135 RepID=A0A1B0ZJ83_9MICO|nr:hypothetical protein DAD186_14380 [Dermabacter vaginalis]
MSERHNRVKGNCYATPREEACRLDGVARPSSLFVYFEILRTHEDLEEVDEHSDMPLEWM